MPARNYGLESFARRARTWEALRFATYFTGISKIQNIDVSITTQFGTSVFVACRVLKGLLRNKNVTFTLIADLDEELDSQEFKRKEARCLRGCRSLRCKSINFLGTKTDTSALVEEITSNRETPADMLPIWKQTYFEYFVQLPDIDGAEITPIYPPEMESLYPEDEAWADPFLSAVFQHDTEGARQCASLLLEQAADWIEEWEESRAAAAEKKHAQALAAIREDKTPLTRQRDNTTTALQEVSHYS
ncbi:hypothetical protein OHC33_002073 [Knufia fluminis]|uniref:Uncharacterized protein n=1 Tax=Knufia fluminis TaxID=191047 RepID=A0AAN8IR05_9EURO|nr:hypothetical protein OHC33_002073 [Knufia fluminis]